MLNLKYELELLCELQDYDLKIDEMKKKITKTPCMINEKTKILENKKNEMNVRKRDFVELSSLKKEKEVLLDVKNEIIRKRSKELNTIKSNNIYKTLLLEIEKAKTDKNVIEDEILYLMDKIDKELTVIKFADIEFKKFEQKIKNEISDLEYYSKDLEEEIIKVSETREIHKLKINETVLVNYERLRNSCSGKWVSFIDGISCEVCDTVLRPQLINMVQKFQELVFCDNCSRILFKR
ncbi:MAG: C4-type zinc ribbon domain-containing protein [Endomicrobium sp.]|jgi:predicted  nucleic acid-binding Zn-ribbon protein|nr:C4-type zinc ribbon domain-containing protein [Endomicrobium sp.]